MTGLLADGVRLALVLGHAGVDVLHDIRADRGREDLGEDLGGTGGLAIGADDGDGRSGGHCFRDGRKGLQSRQTTLARRSEVNFLLMEKSRDGKASRKPQVFRIVEIHTSGVGCWVSMVKLQKVRDPN